MLNKFITFVPRTGKAHLIAVLITYLRLQQVTQITLWSDLLGLLASTEQARVEQTLHRRFLSLHQQISSFAETSTGSSLIRWNSLIRFSRVSPWCVSSGRGSK